MVKSEAYIVNQVVKWLIRRIKRKQKELKSTDYYYIQEQKGRDEEVINELISIKIFLEKYYKQVRDTNQYDINE